MGFMDEMKKLVKPYAEDDEDDFDDFDAPEAPAPRPSPSAFDDTVYIAEHLRNKCAVVLNLEQTNKDVARRLVDFLSGCAYALDGKIKKVAVSTYIITPYNVDIVGDLIDELENSGLYL